MYAWPKKPLSEPTTQHPKKTQSQRTREVEAMVYDFGCLTEKSYSVMGESTRSMSSSDAEFEIEDRPALIRNQKRSNGLSTSLRGRPRSTGRDVMSISLRDRPRSTSATRRIAAVIGKLKEKEKSDGVAGDIGVELLDDDDGETDLRANEKTFKNNEKNHQDSEQGTTGKESSFTNRPQILRAPSFAAVETPSDIISEVAEISTNKPSKEITSTPGKSKRIWSQRLGKQINDSVPNIPEVPASPTPHKSPPRSPRRPSILANVKITSLDIFPKDASSNEQQQPVPESPSTKTPRSSSPMKVFGQRAMNGILRSRKKSADDNCPPTLEVEEDFSTTTTNTYPVAPMSPTKRAIAGILRACSLHDRSASPEKIGTKTGSVHERTMPSSMRKSKNTGSQRNSDDQHAKADDEEKNAVKSNTDELTRGETEMPSNSERGTRSSARVVDIDNASTYSRAVKSLVSPRQTAKRRLRAASIRDPEKLVKSGIARTKRQSQRGNSSPKQARRLSNGNSVTSRRDDMSLGTNTTSGGRTRSLSRTRRLSSHGSSRETDADEHSAIHQDSVSRRTSSRRNASAPRTSRGSKSAETEGSKSVSRTSSSRKVSELQVPFPDNTITPKSKKSSVPADSLQSTFELHIPTEDEPKSPASDKIEDQENGKEVVKRSVSSRRIAREGSNHESLPKRSSARRGASSGNTEQLRTPRANRSEELDDKKSLSRPRSRPSPSDVQIPFTDDVSITQLIKSETQTTSDKSKTRGSSSRRGTSEQHSPTVDDLKSMKRSGSRRNVSDIEVPAREDPKSPRSRRSGVSVSSSKEISRRSRSTCPGSSNRTSVKRVSSARIGSALEINVSPRDEEKSLATERSNSSRTVKRSGSGGSKVTRKSPGRIPVEEEEAK